MVLDLVNRQHTNPERKNERKSLKWILLDSLIIGAIAAWACAPNWIPSLSELWIMAKAFGAAFFLQLAIERGLKRT